MSAAKVDRQTLEQNLADQAVQLSTLQTQLSSAKASYETEMSLLSTLKDRRLAQLADIQKTREELIRAESDLSAIRVEKAEIEGSFLRDKEEARELHKRMIETGQQAEALKAEVEKLKKEAKQQKGLLAIARKQLSSKEAEKAKVEKEHEEAVAEVVSANEEQNALDAELASMANSASASKARMGSLTSSESLIFAAAQPLPATPDLSQSVKLRNNPFERLTKSSTSPTPRSQSPFQIAATLPSLSPSLPGPINGTSSLPLDVGTTASVVKVPVAFEEPSLPTLPNDIGVTSLQIGAAPDRTSLSSTNEPFVTPPTSAVRTATSDSTSSAAVKFPALEDLSTPFASAPKVFSPTSVGGTDLNDRLEELGDDDSDSEDEVENVDAVPAAKILTNGNADAVAPSSDSDGRDGTLDSTSDQPGLGPLSSANLFDEIFDTSVSQPVPQAPADAADQTPSLLDAFTPADKPSTSLDVKPVDTAHVAGVDEFDKILNNMPAATSSATDPKDFFDDSFGDNFDFDAAKVEFPTAPVDTTTQPQQQHPPETSSTFDNIFGSSSMAAPVSTTSVPSLPPTQFDTTFNDIFDGLDTGPSSAGNKFSESPEASSFVPAPSAASPVPSNEESMPGAFPSQPVSPITSRTSADKDKSSPARVGSPKLRFKDTNEKQKDPAPHRHRLSVGILLLLQVLELIKFLIRLSFLLERRSRRHQCRLRLHHFLNLRPEILNDQGRRAMLLMSNQLSSSYQWDLAVIKLSKRSKNMITMLPERLTIF